MQPAKGISRLQYHLWLGLISITGLKCAFFPYLYFLACIDLIFVGSNDFVFFQRDDPKVVGDGVCEFTPLFGQRLTKEPQNCFCELAECGVVTIVGDPFMHDAPETFYRV